MRANHNGLVRLAAHTADDVGNIAALDRLFREEITFATGPAEPGFELVSALAVGLRNLFRPLQEVWFLRRREMDLLGGADRAQTQHKNGESGPTHGQVILHGGEKNNTHHGGTETRRKTKSWLMLLREMVPQCSVTLAHMVSRLIQKMGGWLHGRKFSASPASADKETESAQVAEEEPAVQLFQPSGNCLGCRNYHARVAGPHGEESAQSEPRAAICAIRGMELREPLTTFCKNFASAGSESSGTKPPGSDSAGSHSPGSDSTTFHPAKVHPAKVHSASGGLFGATYAILVGHSGVAIPWVDLAVPRVAPATCDMCGAQSETGIQLELPDGHVECCGPQHYLDWWTDYLRRRLEYFKLLGERAYSDMYDVIRPTTAAAYYSDAKEAFYSAISTVRDLELTAEQQAIEERLAYIKAVFRSQFK